MSKQDYDLSKSVSFKLNQECIRCHKVHKKISALQKCYNKFCDDGKAWAFKMSDGNAFGVD